MIGMCLFNLYSEEHRQAAFCFCLTDASAIAVSKSKLKAACMCRRTVCIVKILRFHKVLLQQQTSRQSL